MNEVLYFLLALLYPASYLFTFGRIRIPESSFVINLAEDNVEALQQAKQGVVQGFKQAEKMWGGELPEISYQTQEKTIKIIDDKINELLKTDAQKELESNESPDIKE